VPKVLMAVTAGTAGLVLTEEVVFLCVSE
jgi:hypothetical protein